MGEWPPLLRTLFDVVSDPAPASRQDPFVRNWTPTYTNLTVGNGTVIARFQQVGKVVWFYFSFDLGSTSSVGTDPKISLPVEAAIPANDLPQFQNVIGNCVIRDQGTNTYLGYVGLFTVTQMVPWHFGVTGSLVQFVSIGATAPMTWTTNDRLILLGSYEAA